MVEQRRRCAACGTANEEDARYCEGCGASMARVCVTCGVEASATARFCRGCGAPLESTVAQDVPDVGPVRKTVTVMFADLAGSTGFEEKVDAETAREVIGRYHDLLRSTARRHRAGVTKYIGDGFMAVWGVPEIGPDDAAHAVEAAVDLQERFVDLAERVAATHRVDLALRVAVNTGEVVVGAGDADLVGDALNVGARLEAECPRGHVVVGEETWRSTRGRHTYEALGEVPVKGRTAPVAVYRWLGRRSETDTAPFVGRSDEMRRLVAVLDDAITARAARMVTVVGDPGVGKSRLAAEFIAARSDARVVEARCDIEGTVALAPLIETLRDHDLKSDVPADIPERDRLLRDLNGLATGVAGSVEENFWALRRLIEVLAADAPVLVVFDDIQWADALLLDFIEHLVEWVQETPVLVLALARPELREMRPDLVTASRWVAEAVHLDGLDAADTAELVVKVLGTTALPSDLLGRLPSSTGGNPLFLRELIGMLVHDGVLVEQPSGWRLTIDVDAISIPPTIQALLASRLERLDATDRRILEVASVVGSDFSPAAVGALAGGLRGVMLSLNRLRLLELVQPSGSYIGDEPVWRFHHVLIRDVAYRRLLKSDRADLHERLADWVDAGGPSAAFDADEMIARHLEAAHSYRAELGSPQAHCRELALRAARRYAVSSRRALDRDELVSAGTQAARGAALAAADDAVHAELLLIGCEAFLSAGDVAAGAPLVDELDRISGDTLAPWAICYRCQFLVYTEPERLLEVDERLQSAIDEFGRRNDAAGLAKAHRVRAGARARLGRIGDCEVDLFEALIAARRSADHRQITAALGAAPSAALWGPSPVPKAGGRCLDVVRMQRMTTAAPSLEATSLRCLAVLEMLRGRPDKARTMLADARQVVADLGLRHGLMETELFAGIIESMQGDFVAAEPHFRTALEGLDALGVGADAGQAAALLARSVLAQGRVDEADRYATESERLAGRNLKTAIAWRAARAEILAAQRRYDEAAVMARDAVAVAAGTDLVLDHAEACLVLSRVLEAAGDGKGSSVARADADRLYAAKEVASGLGRPVDQAAPLSVEPVAASRLAVRNRASEKLDAVWQAYRTGDVDGAVADFSDHFAYDDRRRFGGYPVMGVSGIRAAAERARDQYPYIKWRTLAVRGERLELRWIHMSDDAGNESTTLNVFEVDNPEQVDYWGRFDEDDFEGAYRELESRYATGEGAEFATGTAASTEVTMRINAGDFDRVFGELLTPDMRVENRTMSGFPDRSLTDLRAAFGQLNEMVTSARMWTSAICWLSPACAVTRVDREAVGPNAEKFAWTRLIVIEVSQGRLGSMCEFEVTDESSAFAYAEARVRASRSRVAMTNRASRTNELAWQAMRNRDIDALMAIYADQFVYEDRRRLAGDPVTDHAGMRAAVARVLDQYSDFEMRVLAVRGERLELSWSRWSDTTGNQTTYLHVHEFDGDGRVVYDGRFDEDDFESAYRELERRYYAGEGAAFAAAGAVATDYVMAYNRGDFDRMLEELTTPGMRFENRSQSVFPDRSIAEFRASIEELSSMVTRARQWHSVICWLSPTCCVTRSEREALGRDGEQYRWTWIYVSEIRDGQATTLCQFDIDDEQAALAYADELMRASTSRLTVANRASRTMRTLVAAMNANDLEATLKCLSDGFTYDDRRRLAGAPLGDSRAAMARILAQYNHFEMRTIAVRGQRLLFFSSRWADDAGNATSHLHVQEIDDDGRIEYEARFDEDDFVSAYCELERRYHAGEGAAFAESGALRTEWMVALNRGEFDRLTGELATPDAWLENRSGSAFSDGSLAEVCASLEQLAEMMASVRTWSSAVCPLSPTCFVSRQEREAVGKDGEEYSWTRIFVTEARDGRLAFSCQFDIDDEEAAFAYAEEKARTTACRLAVTNRAKLTWDAAKRRMQARDSAAAAAMYAEQFTYDDRRRLGGPPIDDVRTAQQRILEQYDRFEGRSLAVRGEGLHLGWTRWSNDSGFETSYLIVHEVDEHGRFVYEGRFDDDDFEGAYRELERRYYAGEGAGFAEAGEAQTEWLITLNSSAATAAMSRTWLSALLWVSSACCVNRIEREAVGRDGEPYTWTRLIVVEFRNSQMTLKREFDVTDEAAAFAYVAKRASVES